MLARRGAFGSDNNRVAFDFFNSSNNGHMFLSNIASATFIPSTAELVIPPE